MTTSFTTTAAETFTVVHARQIASKVAADLKRFQRFYNAPSDAWIDKYEGELVELLKHDVVAHVVYGFKRNGRWTEATVRYDALPGGLLSANDDPGKIRPNLDTSGAVFGSFLTYNNKWNAMTSVERVAISRTCPFQRVDGDAPALEAGSWVSDLSYVAAGRGLGRSTVRR